MARYTGWRRLSGDTADRPDLLDLGKRLLGELDTQRRLSGVKTLILERQAPDGSTVRVGFIYEQPFIEVQAASNPPLNARRAIALRMFTYLFSSTPRRYIRALVELDYFDAETFELVGKPRRVLAYADNGSGVPRTNFCFTFPSGQPYQVDDQSHPQYVGIVLSNSFGLYDSKLRSLGNITNSLWASVYGEGISVGSETYEASAALPGGTIISLGAARDSTPSFTILEPLIFAIDATTRQATAGQKLDAVLGLSSVVWDFQASPATDHVFLLVSTPDVRLIKVSAVLANVGALDFAGYNGQPALAFTRDGRLFVYAKINALQQYTIFEVDPASLTILQQRTFDIPSQAWLARPPRMFLGVDDVYCITEDAEGPCVEVRRQVDFGLERRIPLDALEPVLTGVVLAPAWVLGPGERRIYLSNLDGKVAVLDGTTGALLETFDASSLDQNTGFPVQGFAQDESFYTASNVSVSRNFFLAR